ncbi:hypothetical protein BKA70DRAFT_1373436 [Coprinopsis sp. MPI-PUGE-AT-0042]|nr:hypothetical protein BKA70DRAFT_1373436 [Coprinopsis sp. MPI-PUGE-AT-0042]
MGYGRHLSALPIGKGSARLYTGHVKKVGRSTKVKLLPAFPSSPAKKTLIPGDPNDQEWEDYGVFVEVPLTSTRASTKVLWHRLIIIIWKFKQTSRDYMVEWLPRRDGYLDELLRAESPPEILQCCLCGSAEDGLWRCTECVGSRGQAMCRRCCRDRHISNPFHRVENYNPKGFFQPSWLWRVGTHVGIGTCSSNRCSVPSEDGSTTLPAESLDTADWTDHEDFTFGAKPPGRYYNSMKVLTVVHVNGVHHIPFAFCTCHEALAEDIQLLRAGFYPSTYKDIRTVFTFPLLNDYSLSTLECFTSTHHYYAKLRRLTNKAFPGSVPDRTRELRRAGRQWRSLKERRRHGVAHTGKIPGRGDLAFFCAACPQPGVNLPDDWEDDPEQWKYTRSFVGDGNMTCVHRHRPGQSDVYLKDGEGFMTARNPYSTHIETTVEAKEKRTCHEHRAVSNKSKIHKGCDATGIGAWACMRHGCFCPGGVADFQKGERQMNMDFALSEALKTTCSEKTRRVILAYDINCQYSVHLCERFRKGQYLELANDLVFVYGIGLFHVHGHQDSCYARFALTFIRGAGIASREILESLWAVVNKVARTTATMTMAHRLEVLDAIFGDSNWKKMLNLVPSICKNWKNSRLEMTKSEEDFELLNETASPNQRLQWEAQLDHAQKLRERKEDPSPMDILNAKIVQPPTQTKVQHDLMATEQTSNTGVGVTSWVASGMKILEDQRVVSGCREQCRAFIKGSVTNRTDRQALDIAKKREQLQVDINAFYDTAAALFPDADFKDIQCDVPPQESVEIEGNDEQDLVPMEANDNPFSLTFNTPENVEIPLPSSFPVELPDSMSAAALCERNLRIAQLNDCLERIRTDIGHKSYLYRSNVRLAEGKKGKTRGYTAVANVDKSMRINIKIYHQARWALQRLDGDHPDIPPTRSARQRCGAF